MPDVADSTEEVPPDKVLHFRDALPGFPGACRFAMTKLDDEGIFQVLQSLDDPDLSLVVTVPWVFFPDYAPELSEDDQQGLGIEQPEDAVVFCTVTAEPGEDQLYLNLLGPFVVNVRTREGRQVVLADSSQPVRAAVPLGG